MQFITQSIGDHEIRQVEAVHVRHGHAGKQRSCKGAENAGRHRPTRREHLECPHAEAERQVGQKRFRAECEEFHYLPVLGGGASSL